ncbi:MAG: Rnf-Nqr domain containing protein [Alistipes indistinctus]
MENILSIFVKAIFVENMVFAFFFGMCSYIAVSKSVKTAMGLGIAVTFVMVMTVPLELPARSSHVPSPGALGWVDPEEIRGRWKPNDRPEFPSGFYRFYRSDRFCSYSPGRNGGREIHARRSTTSWGFFLPLIAVNCAIMECVRCLCRNADYATLE